MDVLKRRFVAWLNARTCGVKNAVHIGVAGGHNQVTAPKELELVAPALEPEQSVDALLDEELDDFISLMAIRPLVRHPMRAHACLAAVVRCQTCARACGVVGEELRLG